MERLKHTELVYSLRLVNCRFVGVSRLSSVLIFQRKQEPFLKLPFLVLLDSQFAFVVTCKVRFYSLSLSPLQYCLSDKPDVQPLDPFKTSLQKYPITEMQPVYFVANTFEDAKQKLM